MGGGEIRIRIGKGFLPERSDPRRGISTKKKEKEGERKKRKRGDRKKKMT